MKVTCNYDNKHGEYLNVETMRELWLLIRGIGQQRENSIIMLNTMQDYLADGQYEFVLRLDVTSEIRQLHHADGSTELVSTIEG